MINRKTSSELLIHLDRLDHNVSVIRERIGSNVHLMAVVKDNAYGHGGIVVAKHIQDTVEWFCVSEIEEGIELRKNGIVKPILVFEVPRLGTASHFVEYDLTASVSDLDTIPELIAGTSYHVLFDTGMHRLGVTSEQVSSIKEQIASRKDVECTGIYTHFANADNENDTRVVEQYSLFKEIKKAFPQQLYSHAANTGTIFNYGKEYLFDGVRPGVALTGYSPDLDRIPGLKPILEWTTYISQVRNIQKGEYVGYGNEWKAEKDGFVATIPIGYADGISRSLKNMIELKVNGRRYRQIGNVTMDYMMIFSSEGDLKRGDTVHLIDLESNDAFYWAGLKNSLPYEVTTQLPERITRRYK